MNLASSNPLQKPPRQTDLGSTAVTSTASSSSAVAMTATAAEYNQSNGNMKINGTLYKAANQGGNPDLIPQVHAIPAAAVGNGLNGSSGEEEEDSHNSSSRAASGGMGFISSLKRKKRKNLIGKAAVTESTENFANSAVDMGRLSQKSTDMLHASPTVTNTTTASSFEGGGEQLQPHIYANQLSSDALYPQNSFSPATTAQMWVDSGRSPVLTHRDHLMSRSANPAYDPASARTLGGYYSPQLSTYRQSPSQNFANNLQQQQRPTATLPRQQPQQDWRGSGPLFRDFGYPSDFGLPMPSGQATLPRGGIHDPYNHVAVNPLGDLLEESDIVPDLSSGGTKGNGSHLHYSAAAATSSPLNPRHHSAAASPSRATLLTNTSSPSPATLARHHHPLQQENLAQSPVIAQEYLLHHQQQQQQQQAAMDSSAGTPPSSSSNSSRNQLTPQQQNWLKQQQQQQHLHGGLEPQQVNSPSSSESRTSPMKGSSATTIQRTSSGSARESPDEGIQDDCSTDV